MSERLCSIVLCCCLFVKSAAAHPLSRFEAVETHMGTLMRITLYATDRQSATSALRAAFDRIHQLDQILSDYNPDSELNTICRTAVGRYVPVSEDLYRVLAVSLQLSHDSEGAFDITLGPVIRIWRTARSERRLPQTYALQQAATHCGYRKLHLNVTDHSAMLDESGMQLDVGGIGKGYAADEALAVLTGLGIHSALVAASGDLAFSDAPPGTRGWRIGLASTEVLVLSNAAVSTSGDTEQHLDAYGTRYSHVIDPATNIGLSSGSTVTVLARLGINADGLSTAVSVLGVERGLNLIMKYAAVEARVITPGSRVATLSSPRAKSYRQVAPPHPSTVRRPQ